MVSKQQAWAGHEHEGREVGLGTVWEGQDKLQRGTRKLLEAIMFISLVVMILIHT